MKQGANLDTPKMDVIVTSLGYRYFHGPVWWSLTNNISEKEKLENLYWEGLNGDTFLDKSSWDDFETMFNASMKNKVDLAKETWLTICGGTIGGYFFPVFEQYKIISTTDENPLAKQALIVPRTAEFDTRLAYQANVIFNFTDYTKIPISCRINGMPPEAVKYNDYMCVVSSEYLGAFTMAGDVVSLTVQFSDGSEDTVEISIKNTTYPSYKSVFNDVGIDTAAWEFIHPLVNMGIIDGAGSVYRPDDDVTYTEFYAMLEKTGAKISATASPGTIPAAEAEELLFSLLTSKQNKARYNALNKQHLWQPNAHNDLTVNEFAFLDMVLPAPYERVWDRAKPDVNIMFTRAQAAEVIYRFIRLAEYADKLIESQNPVVRPTSSTILVDGEDIVFDAYNIGGNNYFKLRDLAYALNGTSKQFSVDFNSSSGRIDLKSNKPYVPIGGELEPGSGNAKTAIMDRVYINVDYKWRYLTAYKIDGYNYFKLRDLASMLDFGVTWDNELKTIAIDTSTGYSE
jgi:hypothetical protein